METKREGDITAFRKKYMSVNPPITLLWIAILHVYSTSKFKVKGSQLKFVYLGVFLKIGIKIGKLDFFQTYN